MTRPLSPNRIIALVCIAIFIGAMDLLLLLACMFAANHVAARVAMDHGVNVTTAVAARSLGTALVVTAIVWLQRVPRRMTARHRRVMPAIALLVAVQSLSLYAAVARIPVGLALLAFNSYPLWAAFFARVLYRHHPPRSVLLAMPVILVRLALALDVAGAASGLDLRTQWQRIGPGVGFALLAGGPRSAWCSRSRHGGACRRDGRMS